MASNNDGFHITPLTLWVAGGLGGLLWAVLFAQNLRRGEQQDRMQEAVTTLVTSQQFNQRDIDAVKVNVSVLQQDVNDVKARLWKLEPRK